MAPKLKSFFVFSLGVFLFAPSQIVTRSIIGPDTVWADTSSESNESVENEEGQDEGEGEAGSPVASGLPVEEAQTSVYSNTQSPWDLTYFAIFFGPSVGNPKAYQPTVKGAPDLDRPVLLRNFLGLGYMLTPDISVSGTAVWNWQAIGANKFEFGDPYIRVAHHSLLQTSGIHLYADVRSHLPVTAASKENDLLFGAQGFQALTFDSLGRFLLGLYFSERYNVFGSQGFGNDFEMYVGTGLNYQLSPPLALSLLFEVQARHPFGEQRLGVIYDEVDFEPGVMWEIRPNLLLNPYFHIPVNGTISLASTSVGMFLSWTIL